MSVQLREPCTRSLRRLILKPWPVLLHSPKKALLVQGNATHNHPTLFIPIKWNSNASTRSYTTTTTAALRIIPEDPAIIESSLIKHNTCKIKNKRKITRLWTQYQTTFLESKHTLDLKQYDVLISALLEKASNSKKPGFWARIIQAFEESRTLDIQPSQHMYLAAIKAYGKTRDLHKVNCLFQEYKKRFKLKPISYEYYLTAVLHCGELNAAHRIFRDINMNLSMTKFQVSICLADFVSVCIRKNNILLALKAVESFHSTDWDKEALDRVTQSLWNGFGFTVSIDPLSVESFIQMYIEKSKSTTVTEKLWIPFHLFTMFHLLCRNSIVPTTTTCNILLDFADHHLGNVRSILSTMLELNIEPNNETINILTRLFGVQHIEGNLYSYFLDLSKSGKNTTLVKEGSWIGNEDKMLQRLYSSNCVDIDCYAIVLESWIQKGQWSRCILEYDQLKIILPDVDTNRRAVKAMLIARMADTHDWSQISNLVKNLKIQFTSTTIFRLINTMINLENKQGQPLISGKNIFKSLQILESVLKVQLNAESIGRVIKGLGNRGDIENGYRIYNWVRELSPNKEERCSNSNIYRALMASATKNNDIRRLERAWVDMQYRKRFLKGCENECKELHSLTSYNILLNGYASRLPRPDLTRVKRLFQRMLKQNMTPDIVTYNILIKAFVNANNMDSANQIFRKMIQSGIKPDSYTTNTILNGWIIKKDWTHVEKLVLELKSSKCSNLDIVTFNLIVQSFLQLDSKSMNYTHLLKNQNKWSHIRRLEELDGQKDKEKMSSKKIWTIFESTTGYSQKLIVESKFNSQQQQQQEPNGNAFVRLFSKSTEADQITYKLFMKAFVNIGDLKSASKVYQWMRYRFQIE